MSVKDLNRSIPRLRQMLPMVRQKDRQTPPVERRPLVFLVLARGDTIVRGSFTIDATTGLHHFRASL